MRITEGIIRAEGISRWGLKRELPEWNRASSFTTKQQGKYSTPKKNAWAEGHS